MKHTILAGALLGAFTVLGACAKTTDGGSAPNTPAATTPAVSEPVATQAAPPADPANTPAAPATGTATESADYGKYYGSCKKDASKHCSDSYCKGPQCEQLMGNSATKCDAAHSFNKCPDGATAICLLPTDIGGNIVYSMNFYYDGENHEASCKAFGAKMLKQ